jgi:Xaa-Pro aminopeptidase
LLVDANPVDVAWGEARPPPPSDGVRVHPMEWAGESVTDKVARMRKQVRRD